MVSAQNAVIDFPSWISAICAVAAIVISIVTASKSKKYYSEYALVSSDGTVLSHKGFENYGLHVIRNFVAVDDDRPETKLPEYTLQFSKAPSYFEISTCEGAVVRLSQSSPLSYTLRFVGAGFGSPVIESNFKIQVY